MGMRDAGPGECGALCVKIQKSEQGPQIQGQEYDFGINSNDDHQRNIFKLRKDYRINLKRWKKETIKVKVKILQMYVCKRKKLRTL